MAGPEASRRSASDKWFSGRNVIVTGASSGIGRNIGETFASFGAQVALLARREKLREELTEKVRKDGGIALPITCDVTWESDLQRAIGHANRVHGHFGEQCQDIDSQQDSRDERRRPAANHGCQLFGTVHATQAVLPTMQKNRRGNIVNVGSLLERRDISSAGGYCATKFAVVGFTEALRVELFVTGVYRGTWFNGLCYCS